MIVRILSVPGADLYLIKLYRCSWLPFFRMDRTWFFPGCILAGWLNWQIEIWHRPSYRLKPFVLPKVGAPWPEADLRRILMESSNQRVE